MDLIPPEERLINISEFSFPGARGRDEVRALFNRRSFSLSDLS